MAEYLLFFVILYLYSFIFHVFIYYNPSYCYNAMHNYRKLVRSFTSELNRKKNLLTILYNCCRSSNSKFSVHLYKYVFIKTWVIVVSIALFNVETNLTCNIITCKCFKLQRAKKKWFWVFVVKNYGHVFCKCKCKINILINVM